jgi:hypothetical protein
MTIYNPITDQLYGHLDKTQWFREYCLLHPEQTWYWPNKTNAPWHLQWSEKTSYGYTEYLNLYPHKPTLTSNCKTATTIEEIQNEIYATTQRVEKSWSDYARYSDAQNRELSDAIF